MNFSNSGDLVVKNSVSGLAVGGRELLEPERILWLQVA